MSRAMCLRLLVALAAVAAPAWGQDSPALVTDRPDQTESAVVVPPGTLQIELGADFARDTASGAATEVLEVPSTMLRYGLSSRSEVRLAWPGVLELERRENGASERVSGAGDPELSFKFLFLSMARGGSWSLALLARTTIPVGSEKVGSPRGDPSVRLLGEHQLGEHVGLGWNVGFESGSFEDSDGDRHTLDRFVYTCSLGVDLDERWGSFFEVFGDFPASDPAPEAHSFDAGLSYLVAPRVQVDLSAGIGLNAAAIDWFVGAGLSFRLPR